MQQEEFITTEELIKLIGVQENDFIIHVKFEVEDTIEEE